MIYAYSHDPIPVKDLVTSLNVIGQNNVLLDLPTVIEKKLQALSGFSAVEEVSREDKNHHVENTAHLVYSNQLSVILALIVYFVMN